MKCKIIIVILIIFFISGIRYTKAEEYDIQIKQSHASPSGSIIGHIFQTY